MPGAREAIGVDVGGTRIRVVRVGAGGTAHDRRVEPVAGDRRGFSAQLARMVAAVRRPETAAVGVGVPGRVRGGAILSAGHLDVAGLDLAALCDGLPVRVENDAAMALAAEARARSDGARGVVAMLTVGTGIGGAIAADGRPWTGGGVAGQFGHLVVAADGPPCNCGRAGCVEALSSGTAFGRVAAAHGLPPGVAAAEVLDRAGAGNAACGAAIDAWSRPFARAIETLASAIDPRLVIVGGGLGADMVRALGRHPTRSPWFEVPVEAARLGDDAGALGAGLVALGTPDAGAHPAGPP